MTVAGAGFATGSLVLVNGNSRPTAYVSSTLLQPTLLATDLSKGGTLTLTVVNPPPGAGISESIGLTVADYSVASPTPGVSVTAGQTANFALTVSPIDGAFTNPVTFHVSPSALLPAGAAASFAPSATITPGASPQSVKLSISTTAPAASHLVYFPHGGGSIWMLISVAVTALVLAIILIRMPEVRMQRRAPQILLAFLLAVASVLVACSAVGTGSSPPSMPSPAPGTPAGTYPIIVTAISGGVSHSTTITLTVMQ